MLLTRLHFFALSAAVTLAQSPSVEIASNYRVQTNVTYMKEGTWEGKLDIYQRTDSAVHPTLVYFHGGDSLSSSKEPAILSLLPYLEWGWNVVNVEHHYPSATIAPAAMANAFCAVRWVVRNAGNYGFDASRLVLSGGSSGGWFALTSAIIPRPDGSDPSCPGNELVRVAPSSTGMELRI